MKKIVIVGAGTWGIRLAHYIISDKKFEVVGFLDDYKSIGELVNNIPIIGSISDAKNLFNKKKFDSYLIAIGYAHFEEREIVYELLRDQGIPPATFIHSTAYIDSSATIGTGTVICPGAFIDMAVEIKENVYLGTQSHLSHNSVVDSSSYIGPSAVIAGDCYIGKKCMLGVGSILRDGLTIKNNVVIGTGAVVVKNIEKSGTYIGAPAKIITK